MTKENGIHAGTEDPLSQEGLLSKEKEAALDTTTSDTNKQLQVKDEETEKAPNDKLNIVYMIMLVHGVGTLMPWNMFINAFSYFTEYKLASPPKDIINQTILNSSDSTNLTIVEVEDELAMYRGYFLSYLGFVAQIPNVLLNAINLFCHCGGGGDVGKRITWSIIIVVIMFIITVILAMLDSSTWGIEFFWITMITVAIINMANGVYQNSVYGTAACLPMKYTNAVVLGSNISGTLTAVLMLISIASTPNPRTSAIYYFLAAIVVLLVAFDTYFALPFLKFYRYYSEQAKKHAQKHEEATGGPVGRPPFLQIFVKCWKQDIGVWAVFFVTLSVFPAIQANVKPVDENFWIPPKFFAPVTCFLFFNAFAVLGNITTEFIRFPGPRFVWIPIAIRFLFIPFFCLCNTFPDERAMPALITNEYVYMIGAILNAFTSGYFSSLTMMYAPRNVEPHHQGTAGMMAAFFLISGIFSGILFSFPLTYFIKNIGAKN